MIAEFTTTFCLMAGFVLGYLACTMWHFFLACREDWEQDNVH